MTKDSASTAALAAHRFRVEQTDEGIVLVDQQNNGEHRVEVRRTFVHLTIEASVLKVCRSLVPGGLDRWLALDMVELSIGLEGDFSDLSVWPDDEDHRYDAENQIFGIDGPNLEHLEVAHAQVVDLEAHGRSGHPYIDGSVDSAPDAEDNERNYREHEDDEDRAPTAKLWYHSGEDDSGYRWSALMLTVGFPEPQFSELVEACESGRADTLVLECSSFYAKTTGWAFGSARDLILSPGESVRLDIEEATMSAPVSAGASHSPAIESEENGARVADHNEWDRERNVSAPHTTTVAGPALLIATIAVSVLAALFGAGAVAVLTIAILGGIAALIATLSSIGIALTQRLTLLSEVNVEREGR